MSSLYCILAYIPFTYYQFLQFVHLDWLAFFAARHHLLNAALVGAVAYSLRGDLKAPRTRPLAWTFVGSSTVLAVYLLARPLLPALHNDAGSLRWGLAWLAPLVLLAIIDMVGHGSAARFAATPRRENRHIFLAACLTSVVLATIYLGITLGRYGAAELGVGGFDVLLVAAWALAGNLVLMMAISVTLVFIRSVAALFPRPPAAEYALLHLFAAALLTGLLYNVVFAGISFAGATGWLFAGGLAFSLFVYLGALRLRVRNPDAAPADSGLSLALEPLSAGRISGTAGRLATLAALAGLAALLATATAGLDWNFIVQKLVVVLVAGLGFAAAYAMLPRWQETRDRTLILLLLAVGCLGLYRGMGVVARPVIGAGAAAAAPSTRDNAAVLDARDTAAVLDGYAAYDVAFTLVRDTLSPAAAVDDSLFAFLQANTNIPRSAKVAPVDVRLTDELGVDRRSNQRSDQPPGDRPARRPHIFVFVIDSLRQDYLSPYNDRVSFTPEIDRFAADNVVFRNAFSRYGATGLSQPSIWVGGMILHQQYTTPFAPMNALNKLLVADGYQRFLSMDTILRVIVPDDSGGEAMRSESSAGRPGAAADPPEAPSGPPPASTGPLDIIRLDADVPDSNYDLCRSLEDLRANLSARTEGDAPIFAYTQPQNIHISVINREGSTVLDDGDYSGFHPPYASRIRRIDGCFGAFVDYLKAEDLYDDSVIVLTSDHGDSLGEEGRWGHAYTIFPEVIRIPLLVHLPADIAATHTWDESALTFSTDITPSLYYLLGHEPVAPADFFGAPLFTLEPNERPRRGGGRHLVASSYGAVYGLLIDGGSSLYIVDGVNYVDYLYDLRSGFLGTRGRASEAMKREYRALIRSAVERIGSFYGFVGGEPAGAG